MSRCFPFPPPGYERKAGAENVDLLKQEKHKEKKHKKEKRDKEKREAKEKKGKDRDDEKHRDKKEKKDKRRDKKDKEKDKEREKDRSSTSYEKRQPVQTGYINEEKVLDQKGAPTIPTLQTRDKSIQMEKDKFKNSTVDIKRPSVTLGGHNSEKIISTNHAAGVIDAKCVQELAKRLKTDQCSGSEQVSAVPDHRKNDGKDQQLGKIAIAGLDGKERTKDRRHNNERKLDERVNKEQSRLNGTVKVQGLGEVLGQKKLQEIRKPVEVNAKKMECREIITGREVSDMQRDKLKDRYIDKSQGKGKESRKKEQGTKEKSERKHIDQEKLKEGNKNGVPDSPHLNRLQPVKESNRTVASEGNLKKRKELETNGFLLGDEVRANKLHKQAQCFQLPLENEMEPRQTSMKITPLQPEPINNAKVNSDENKINGVKGAAPSSPISPLHPLLSAAQAELVLAEASSSVKPPHPDSKFLVEILKVPKVDELPDVDHDQAWLFSSNKEDFKNTNGGSSSIFNGTPEVWAESVHIESAEIYALPYVFPY